MKLKDLAVDHPYYCSESNYYSNEASEEYTTFADFYEEWHDANVDYNLIFRWDIKQREESKRYYAEVFYMLQRKGIFKPVSIQYIDEQDVPLLTALMEKHWEHLQKIWAPLSERSKGDE